MDGAEMETWRIEGGMDRARFGANSHQRLWLTLCFFLPNLLAPEMADPFLDGVGFPL